MATTAICKVCDDPLILEIQDDDDEETGAGVGSSSTSAPPQSVPDDLELPCGCHFHWQCLLDQSAEVAISLACPSCDAPLASNTAGPSATNPHLPTAPTGSASIITQYTSEGGLDAQLDILPAIAEEAYLSANPSARPARAFHVMCAEGDVEGIVDLLRDADSHSNDEGEPSMPVAQLLRYQDPLANMKSGLHLAVERAQEEVVWLLLWTASALPARAFPEAAVQAALALGIQQRPTLSPAEEDVRTLTDDRGRTAEAVAVEMGEGGPWVAVLQAGVLHPGNR